MIENERNKHNVPQWGRDVLFKTYFSQKIDEGFFINVNMLPLSEVNKARNIILTIGDNEDFEKAFKNVLKHYKEKQANLETTNVEEIIELKWAIQTVLEYNNDDELRKKIMNAMKKYSILVLDDKKNTRHSKIEESVRINKAIKTIYTYGEGERLNKTLARILSTYTTFLGDKTKFYVDPNKLSEELKYNILSKAKELYILSQNNRQKLTYDEKIISGIKSIQFKKRKINDYQMETLDAEHNKENSGRLIMSDGRIFTGEWKDGKLVKGKCIYPEMGEYNGMFKDLKKEGEGVLVLKNGDVYTGTWKDDFFDGIINLKKKDGQEIKCIYKMGELIEQQNLNRGRKS